MRSVPGGMAVENGMNLLFVPGSYSTGAAWRPIQKLLPPACHMAAVSLCGYGETPETRTPGDADMVHEIALVADAARRLGGPVHLVAHSFGGAVALAAALAGVADIASLVLFEANPFALLDTPENRALHEGALALSGEFEAAVAAGEPDAPRLIIDYWGGDGSFAALPEAVRDYCRGTAASNMLDWRTDFGFTADRTEYAGLTIPVLLVRGEQANAAMIAMTEALRGALPNVRSAIAAGAGHFLISSHPRECASLITEHLDRFYPVWVDL